MSSKNHVTRYIQVFALASVSVTTIFAQSELTMVPVTDAVLQNPAPEDWLMWRRTLDGWGYSPRSDYHGER